jgi:hypothetical protein
LVIMKGPGPGCPPTGPGGLARRRERYVNAGARSLAPLPGGRPETHSPATTGQTDRLMDGQNCRACVPERVSRLAMPLARVTDMSIRRSLEDGLLGYGETDSLEVCPVQSKGALVALRVPGVWGLPGQRCGARAHGARLRDDLARVGRGSASSPAPWQCRRSRACGRPFQALNDVGHVVGS